ncbi:MAG: chorismate synthase [Deltaproteobacteria bacterium]|nr:chorismate synthase [Deltaproteobacteria bacterium]
MLRRLRFLTAGESHGPGLVALLEGIPKGLAIDAERMGSELARRQRGYGRGARMKIESDRAVLRAGVRGGVTLGSPIAILVDNRDHERWKDRMGPEPFSSPPEPMTRARPGHVDLAGGLKLDTHDLRDVLERASARETAARVAAGAVARAFCEACGVAIFAHVLSIGAVAADLRGLGVDDLARRSASSGLRCADRKAAARMRAAIREAAHAGSTLGGVFEVIARGHPAGLGSHVQWDLRLDARLAGAFMSIQAIKGVEIGLGFEAARRRGTDVHDPIGYEERRGGGAFVRASNNAGGTEGGISNGQPIVVRAAMKPISTLKRALESVDVQTKAPALAATERSDVCAVAAASCVGEAMMALVLADAILEKLGGDTMQEVLRSLEAYRQQIERY